MANVTGSMFFSPNQYFISLIFLD
jgi:protein phosphatase 1G